MLPKTAEDDLSKSDQGCSDPLAAGLGAGAVPALTSTPNSADEVTRQVESSTNVAVHRAPEAHILRA